MKRLFVLLVMLVHGFAASAIQCSVDLARFVVANKTYIDINLRVDGHSCQFNEDEQSLFTAHVLTTITISSQGNIVGFEKYRLTASAQKEVVDLLDMKRFFLPAGTYEVLILMEDEGEAGNDFQYKSSFTIDAAPQCKLSDALILKTMEETAGDSPLVRSGFYMEPLPYALIHEGIQHIKIYQEVYPAFFESDKLVLQTELRQEVNDFPDQLSDRKPLTKYKRIDCSKEVFSYATNLDVGDLTSGRYALITSVIDPDKKVLFSRTKKVIVSNPISDLKSFRNLDGLVENSFVEKLDSPAVQYALKAIVPVTQNNMMSTLDFVIRHAGLSAQKYYLFKHWNEAYPGLAKEAYDQYMAIVDVVDKDFHGNVGHGFQTDRGYIYLKYGKPSKFISIIDEPNTPPYEIWYYNFLEATRQTNVRFIFYDRLQANDYELLHSTCLGERKNPAWELQLYKFSQSEQIGPTVLATEVGENWGRRAKKLFNDF